MTRPLPERISSVLFDLDGTLLDSLADIHAACNYMLEQAGRAQLSAEVVRGFVGDGARALVARALGVDRAAPSVPAHLEVFLTYYEAHPLDVGRLYPGARELLTWLGPQRSGIVTNKSRSITHKIVQTLGLEVGVIVAGGDTERLKPSPEPVLLACRSLGVQPASTVFVGDSEQDVHAARAAGCYAIGVLGGLQAEARLRAAAPDLLIDDLTELGAQVRRWDTEHC
jgi:2-phosphoglycolate phosphatase